MGFPLAKGWTNFTIPLTVEPRDDYFIVCESLSLPTYCIQTDVLLLVFGDSVCCMYTYNTKLTNNNAGKHFSVV